MKKLFVTLALVAVSAANATEKIGNGTHGDGGLALKQLMQDTPGLTPEQKIYDMWVKAEGSVPQVETGKTDVVWSGMTVVNIEKSILSDTYRNACLYMRILPPLLAGPITVKEGGTFIGNRLNGTFGIRTPLESLHHCEAYRDDYQYFPDRPDSSGGTAIPMVRARPTSTGVNQFRSILVDLVSPSIRLEMPIEYRQVTADIIVGVNKARAVTTGGASVCYYSATRDPHYFLDGPNPDFGVPGVCEVTIFYQHSSK